MNIIRRVNVFSEPLDSNGVSSGSSIPIVRHYATLPLPYELLTSIKYSKVVWGTNTQRERRYHKLLFYFFKSENYSEIDLNSFVLVHAYT
jgi:hypothetical protein